MNRSKIADTSKAHHAIQVAYATLMDHSEAKAIDAVVDWLDALIEYNKSAMTEVNREKLPDLQTKTRQLVALRRAISDPDNAGIGLLIE